MRNKGVKLLVSLLTVLSLILPMTGCDEIKGVTPMDKEHVYSYEDIEMPMDLDEVYGVFYSDERVYAVGLKYDENINTYLCSMKPDGTDATSVTLKSGYAPETADGEEKEADTADEEAVESQETYYYEWLNQVIMDDKANIYGVYEIYRDYTDENGEYVSESLQVLVCWDKSGELLWSADLTEGIPEEDYFYTNSMLADKDGTIWVSGGMYLKLYDSKGKQLGMEKLPEDGNGNFFIKKDGTVFMRTWNEDYTKQFMQDVDKNTLTFGNKKEFPENIYSYGIMQEGTKYDFILSDSTSIYGYNMGDAEPVEIMDTVDSDLYFGNVSNVQLIDDMQFLATYSDPETGYVSIGLFTKVPAEEVKDKTVIVMAAMYVDYTLRKQVVDFNKSNDEYRIQIKEYNKYATAEDYMAGYTQLNTDIVSGKMPDILIADSDMPLDSYIAKGLIADLNPFIEKDPDINREDYLENIFDAFSQNGKLYRMVPSFEVLTVIGKKSIVGDRTGWNMQEYKEVMDSQPEGTHSFDEMSRGSMLNTALMMTKDEYINADTGECYFNTPGFVELLEFANQFPEEIDYSTWEEDNYWTEIESMYRENRTILLNCYLSDYHDFNRMEKGQFGEDVTFIGFPTESKNGNAIIPVTQITLSAKSGCQEGAWEFIRYYLTDEYQDAITYQFPIKKSSLTNKEKAAMERPYWEDEEGNKEYYDDTYWINDVEITIDPMTQEEASEVTTFLSNLSLVGIYDTDMIDIVTEEAQAFFEGQKSAQEVADIIQSRMKIYVSESR